MFWWFFKIEIKLNKCCLEFLPSPKQLYCIKDTWILTRLLVEWSCYWNLNIDFRMSAVICITHKNTFTFYKIYIYFSINKIYIHNNWQWHWTVEVQHFNTVSTIELRLLWYWLLCCLIAFWDLITISQCSHLYPGWFFTCFDSMCLFKSLLHLKIFVQPLQHQLLSSGLWCINRTILSSIAAMTSKMAFINYFKCLTFLCCLKAFFDLTTSPQNSHL